MWRLIISHEPCIDSDLSIAGVGVDIRVHHSVNFGLSSTMEDLLQESGRVMRGSVQEIDGRQGFAFFLHKGALG